MENNVTKMEPLEETGHGLPALASPLTPMAMLSMAVQQGADIDKLSKLMDLSERWEANEARKAFVAAKAAFKAEAPRIDKNKKVGFDSKRGGASTNYSHATLDHVEELLSPVLSRHGLAYSWETGQTDTGQIRVTCVLTHVLGHSERVVLQAAPDNTGNKNSIQAIGSTATFLSRYTLLLVTGMATGEMDDDAVAGGAPGPISAEQKDVLIDLMKEVDADTVKFLRFLRIPYLDDLPAARFNEARQALLAKKGAPQ